MAHFAELDENNIVIQVIPAHDIYEDTGEELYQSITGKVWKRTSYNTVEGVHLKGGIPFRKNYAGIGWKYDEVKDAFIPPKPFNSWILDENKCIWKATIEYPQDGLDYKWDESMVNWIQL